MNETSLIQARIDSNLKNKAAELFDSLGLDMTTAIRIFFKKCIQEGGIPFEIKNDEYYRLNAYKAFMALREEAEFNGVSDLSIDEINEEIKAARKSK